MACVAGPLAADFPSSKAAGEAIEQAIREDKIPGAVLRVGKDGKTLHHKAYGWRALTPRKERMSEDTIFDAASLTKVVATTSAIMKLFEQGKVRLNDRVTEYLPEFQGGKSNVTVRNLLTHFSGMRPDLDLTPPWSGYETGVKLALIDKPVAEPGERFIYSDINFILLGEIVRRVAGKPLPEFVAETVFRPLGMKDTMFQPPASLRRRIAPTEVIPGQAEPLRGVVHDPTTRYMDGVAGHAGLFTAAADLARFAEMMAGMGQRGNTRIFAPLTVKKFTTAQSPPDQPVLRGLGWDIESPYSGNRGELFPVGSYGHTGFTGTSLWIDPVSKSYVILLTNSVHPRARPAITSLRGRVATIVAAALGVDVPEVAITGYNETLVGAGVRRVVERDAQALTGLDMLAAEGFQPLQGRRLGLITNHTGLSREGERNVDLMVRAGLQIVALFSPEHGIGGKEDHSEIPHSRDAGTGIPIWSLYAGPDRRPSPEMLAGVEALVFDIQDIGARFYTYATTMAYTMEEAAKKNIPFYVLDRPNPITGTHVEGPLLDPELVSFVGYFPIPLRHGMTIGELARLFNAEAKIGADLRVIPLKDWQRGDWFDATGLVWFDPSPNMRSLNAALLYPSLAMLESSRDYSVGRGTDAPFEQIGAGWIRGRELARYLNTRKIPGVRAYATRFRPQSGPCAGQWLEGVRFVITAREVFNSTRLGLEIAAALLSLYPDKPSLAASEKLIGSRDVIRRLNSGEDPREIVASLEEPRSEFLLVRSKYLLY